MQKFGNSNVASVWVRGQQCQVIQTEAHFSRACDMTVEPEPKDAEHITGANVPVFAQYIYDGVNSLS